MPTDKSVAEVEELKTILSEAKLIISTDYRGLSVTEMSALRRAVREGGGSYRVTKNTLVNIASRAIDRPEISEIVNGPTGFVLSTGDPVGPARALVNHINQNRLEMVINGAYVEGQVVDADRVKFLATLPGREELVARVLGQMTAPIANLVGVLNGTIRGLVTVLMAHIDQGGNAAVADQAEASSESDTPSDTPEEGSPEEATEEATSEQAEEPTAEAATEEEPASEAPESEDTGEADEDKPAE